MDLIWGLVVGRRGHLHLPPTATRCSAFVLAVIRRGRFSLAMASVPTSAGALE